MAMVFPMTRMTMHAADIAMTEAEFLTAVRRLYHWHGWVYRSYDRELDFYVVHAGNSNTFYYRLWMPDYVIDPQCDIEMSYDPYPAPSQFFQAYGLELRRVYSADEWAAMDA